MDGKASLVAFTGLALVLANGWRAGTVQQLGQGKFTPGSWKSIGLETLGIIIATAVAGASDQLATVLLAFLGALWLIFLINTTKTKKGAPAS